MKFEDCFSGVKGGERAVDKLRAQAQQYLEREFQSSGDWTIVVRAYANVEGLAQSLVTKGKLRSTAEFRLFVKEFNNRHSLCDFVDVGQGKELADNKVKGEAVRRALDGRNEETDDVEHREFEVILERLPMQAGVACMLL